MEKNGGMKKLPIKFIQRVFMTQTVTESGISREL